MLMQQQQQGSQQGYYGQQQQQQQQDLYQQTNNTQYSQKSNNTNFNVNNQSYVEDFTGGESVKVMLRIRPMSNNELQRGDEPAMKVINENTVQIFSKGINKHFQFNRVLDDRTSQVDCFQNLKIGEMLDAALDGYSSTIFAYGQTGSGKTYTMSGIEEKLGREVYISDETEGIIPRATRYLWQAMAQRQEQFYVKASFTEIYNEQLYDLLNLQTGVLHCRWNVKNGFFVEDLMIVECTNVDDLVAVLHEGMKNRKQGSHDMNERSSRSHSILTIYLISEVNNGDQVMKRYGKISLVDLAGSERLKESNSKGVMVKETGNINKSLFTLGKVINSLSDKKANQPYIPYRDSKLTMLLMDSLGGNAKALMIACVSPSQVYFDETLSTMNYAARTMNIKNKPVVQMDQKDQIIFNLQREIELLRMENKYLREQLQRVSNGLPIEIPDFLPNKKGQLPPLKSSQSTNRPLDEYSGDVPINKLVSEYQIEMNRLNMENSELRSAREVAEKNYHVIMNDNNALQIKLENLERVFIGNPQSKGDTNKDKLSKDYMSSTLILENSELKKRILELEKKNSDLTNMVKQNIGQGKNGSDPADLGEIMNLNQQNRQLQQRVEFLQNRERDLMDNMMKLQKQLRNN
ncbi:P-loop containing nucleoside triphosphate hydrolase [Pseudocohnilembus persalinus]|uniref:Kinesin-like protein n=1 Tax=Pseudocohnilembus persalinus TaxID=266149 RepID=A0A0V0QRQ1_PSEPJ|nr:P-loop containing nucleoside triphosphate hydrolase [Pseudocohnilembus persalinus]|eukprot:KRX04696.1 P-loop containing nucleoside triphosphate hydrolase [Pseudocohnilembus persalinus]